MIYPVLHDQLQSRTRSLTSETLCANDRLWFKLLQDFRRSQSLNPSEVTLVGKARRTWNRLGDLILRKCSYDGTRKWEVPSKSPFKKSSWFRNLCGEAVAHESRGCPGCAMSGASRDQRARCEKSTDNRDQLCRLHSTLIPRDLTSGKLLVRRPTLRSSLRHFSSRDSLEHFS